MKKIKMILPMVAFVFAVVAALAGESSKPLLVDAYIRNSSPCQRSGSCSNVAGTTCQTGTFPNIITYAELSGTTCSTALSGTWSNP